MLKNSLYKGKNVIVTLEYPPMIGGIANYVVEMEKQMKNSRVLFLKNVSGWLDAFKQVWKIRKAKNLIVHHVFPVGTATLLLRLVARTPYSIVLHGMDYDLAKRSLVRRVLLRAVLYFAKHVITNTHALAKEVEQEMGTKASVVHPVLCEEFLHASGSINCKRLPERSDKTLRILTVGRLVDRKNQQAIIKVLPKLDPNVHYDIVGDGPNRTYLSELARQLGVSDRVHIHGAVATNKLPKFYRNADVFVTLSTKNPHDREGFGIVYLEAQYSCRPVLAYEQAGVKEALAEDAVIFTTARNIAEDLRKLLHNPERRLTMGRAGHAFVQNQFLPATMGETLNELFD